MNEISNLNNVITFTFNGKNIRVIGDLNNPMFCLKDVCDALNLSNSNMVNSALSKRFGEGISQTYPLSTNGGTQISTFITESQMYYVIMRSDKKEAFDFQDWVTKEVLPAIRKTGGYNVQQKTEEEMILNLFPETDKNLVILTANTIRENKAQKLLIDYQKPRVDFANTVMQAEKDITLRQLAGLLNIKGLGQNNMAKALRDIEFFMPDTVLPYRVHIEHGRCRLTEKTRIDSHGNIQVYFTTSFTNKGLNYIRRCLENKLGLKPQHVEE